MNRFILYIVLLSGMLSACQDTESLVPEVDLQQNILVGGLTLADDLDVSATSGSTRASTVVDAETQSWLVGPLKAGLDITYGIASDKSKENVAILKLLNDSGTGISHIGEGDGQYAVDNISQYAIYSFKYRDTSVGDDAQWYGNGAHYFEGVYVPQDIRYNKDESVDKVNTVNAPNITTDQHKDGEVDGKVGNYTLLERYLGMPANTRLSATVARIKLPFRHRLSRVLAYVLIDPAMGPEVKLEGYKKCLSDNKTDSVGEDPTNTLIRFCNVDVLAGVKDTVTAGQDGHHTLTPQWVNKRKVIPHFVGERASRNSNQEVVDADNFIVYFNIKNDTYLFPTDDDRWISARNAYNTAYNKATGTEAEKTAKAETSSGYRKFNYGKVPVYDLIVRPTYTSVDKVMYDEQGVKNADGTENSSVKTTFFNKQNLIDFDITLNNGLQYFKEFHFDLDANFQTIVYLRITRESIDYNSSGSEIWIADVKEDDWYGVDNEGGHSLSDAGSSWQRAYITGKTVSGDKVTDGGYYNETTSTDVNTQGQYVNQDTWIEYFTQAYQGGAHHGDYFALKEDVTIAASQLPIGFVFTGHLDAQDHTITVTGANQWVTCDNEVLTLLRHKTGDDATDESYTEIPQLYYMVEIAQKPSHTQDIDKGTPIAIDMAATRPSDLDGLVLFTKNDESYELYPNRTFYKKNGSALFYGLDGIYSTRQETEAAAGRPIYNQGWEWEANVHKENNVWVPYRDVSDADPANHSGWRAEVINLKVKGQLFEADAVITGNEQNCYEGNNLFIKVKDHIPAIPRY